MKKLFTAVVSIFLFQTAFSQITTTINPTVAQLQQRLQGNGVVISNVSLTCPSGAYALYGNGTGALSALPSGILLTTGQATGINSGNATQNSTNNGTSGSALGDDLDLSGSGTHDECSLTFIITPNCSTLSIKYVFASEEYPENVGFGVSDVFGFAITGPNPSGGNFNQTNIALVPGTNLPVSIDNVNYDPGFPPFIPATCNNCAYYVEPPPGMVYDGSTTVLSASTQVTPCQQYTMTIGVWDVGDGIYDSGVFLDVQGLSCVGNPTLTAVASPSTICGVQTITLTAGGGLAGGTYTWTAPASGGLVTTVGQTVTANPTAATTYTLLYSDANTCPGVPLTKTTTVTFTPPPALPVTQTPAGPICAGSSVTLTATGGAGTYSWSPGTFLSTSTSSVVISTPTTNITYTVTKTLGTCVSTGTITVSVNSTTIAVTPSVSSICSGQSVGLSSSGGGPFTWTASSGANPPSAANVTVSPTTTTTYTVLSGTGSCTASATAIVSITTVPSITLTPANTSICSGQSATLTVTGGGAPYVWTASSGANPANGATAIVSPTGNTTYTVVSGAGTCTASAVSNVSITTAPTVSISPVTSTICSGQSVTLTATGGSAPYNWTASTGTNPSGGISTIVSPTTSTTYTLLSGSGTCTASAVADVSVTPMFTVTITPSNTTICSGETATLVASGASNYIWLPGLNNTATLTANPSSTTSFTVVGTTGPCTNSATATVSIITVSTSVTASSNTYCVGGASVTLTGSGAATYSWSPALGLSSTSGSTVAASPTITTTYSVTGSTGACNSTTVVTITVPPVVSLSVTATNTLLCPGTSATLTASGAGTYTWSPVSGSTSTLGISPAASADYTVTGRTVDGCITVPATITINVAPVINLTVTPNDTTICNGGASANLTVSGATNYTWSPGTGLSNPNSATVSANPTITTVYNIIGATGSCTSAATATVNVISVSTTVAASSNTYCVGGASVTLTGSGATTYSWDPPAGLSSTTGSTVTASPTLTTTYTLTGTTGACNSTTVVTITVPPLVNLSVTATSTVICLNGSGTSLTVSGASTYTWLPGATSTTTLFANPSATTNYTVAGQSAQGCYAIPAIQTVSVSAPINPTITPTSPTVCLTETVTLSAAPNSAGLTYTWSPITAIQGSNNSSTITALPPSTATVNYTVIVSNGVCIGTNTLGIQVKTPPIANNFITLNNDTICVGGCVTFSATTKGSQPLTYEWYYENGVGTSSVGVHPEACYGSAGSFSVMVITSNMCGTDTLVKSAYINVFDYPVLVVHGDTTINIGESAEVFASGGSNYSWSPNINGSIACPSCSSTVVQPTVTTDYIVVSYNSTYCKVQDTVTVIVDVNCGDFFIPNAFSPNDDGLNDVINVHGRCIETFNLQIFNRWGEKVFETSSITDGWDGTFRGQKMNTGVFIYKADGVSIDGQSFNMKGNITLIR